VQPRNFPYRADWARRTVPLPHGHGSPTVTRRPGAVAGRPSKCGRGAVLEGTSSRRHRDLRPISLPSSSSRPCWAGHPREARAATAPQVRAGFRLSGKFWENPRHRGDPRPSTKHDDKQRSDPNCPAGQLRRLLGLGHAGRRSSSPGASAPPLANLLSGRAEWRLRHLPKRRKRSRRPAANGIRGRP
jgi:hypothetical protein